MRRHDPQSLVHTSRRRKNSLFISSNDSSRLEYGLSILDSSGKVRLTASTAEGEVALKVYDEREKCRIQHSAGTAGVAGRSSFILIKNEFEQVRASFGVGNSKGFISLESDGESIPFARPGKIDYIFLKAVYPKG